METTISDVVKHYPKPAQVKFKEIRSLLLVLAKEHQLGDLTETLKWGEPAYLCRTGSTVRIHWRSKNPNTLGIFFNCNTVLVETFKEVFRENLNYEGNRAIIVPLEHKLPTDVESCLLMALNYHKLKKLPLLGA